MYPPYFFGKFGLWENVTQLNVGRQKCSVYGKTLCDGSYKPKKREKIYSKLD